MHLFQQIVFTDKGCVSLQDVKSSAPCPNEVIVRIRHSLMSTGTENIVLNRLFESGSDWDRYTKYPFRPGYASVGEVCAIGKEVTKIKVGDRVAVRVGHASGAVVDEQKCYPIPDGVSYVDALWFALAKISFLGIKAAKLQLGERLLIIGAGPVGQMAIRWALQTGIRSLDVVDMASERRSIAQKGGAVTVWANSADKVNEEFHAQKRPLPQVVMDTTGNHHVFASALELVAKYGRVVLLGVSGFPGKQVLTSDVIRKGLTIVGVHDSQTPPEWPEAAIVELFFSLLKAERFPLDGLVTHHFPGVECVTAYELANSRRAETMGIVFDWDAHA